MSVAGSAVVIVAADRVPSAKVTSMESAPCTTCSAVRTDPSALAMTPVPMAVESAASTSPPAAVMETTDGAKVA